MKTLLKRKIQLDAIVADCTTESAKLYYIGRRDEVKRLIKLMKGAKK